MRTILSTTRTCNCCSGVGSSRPLVHWDPHWKLDRVDVQCDMAGLHLVPRGVCCRCPTNGRLALRAGHQAVCSFPRGFHRISRW